MQTQNPQMQTAWHLDVALASATGDGGGGRYVDESEVSFGSGGRGQMSDRG